MPIGRSSTTCAINTAKKVPRPTFAPCLRAWPKYAPRSTANTCTTCFPLARPSRAPKLRDYLSHWAKAGTDLAKMRIKSQWFQTGTAKTPQQTASAMAFITWRAAQNMLKQMRSADFSIEVGPQYFAFTREVLVFLTQVLDRMAYARVGPEGRAEFVTAL